MNTKTLTNHATSIIDQYLHFKVGPTECSVPYFNNKTVRARASLRSLNGKGSPSEILEEIQGMLLKNHVDINVLTSESLKKVLTDNNIGIDCSAFAYYVLNAEAQELKKGSLDKHIHFVNCSGLIGKIRCSLRPIENCDVATFADNINSKIISLKETQPSDIITMTGGPEGEDRNHILVIHRVEYQNFIPIKIYYSHAVAYPLDGIYGTGIKQGVIEITDSNKNITEQIWSENNLLIRANKSETELRRLNFLC